MKTPTIAEQILLNVEEEKKRQALLEKKRLEETVARHYEEVLRIVDRMPKVAVEMRLRQSTNTVTHVPFGTSFGTPGFLKHLESVVREWFKDEGLHIDGYYDKDCGEFGIVFEVKRD